MRLALDATALLGPRTGVGVFVDEVVRGTAARDDLDVTAFAVTWRGRGGLAAAVPAGVRVAGRPLPARPARRLWRRWPVPPVEWLTGPVDVVHGPNFVVPPTRRAAAVVTVHDLTCLRHPELCTADTLAYPDLIRAAVRRGAWVHAVSGFVADEVRQAFPVAPERVVAVPNGVRPVPDADPARGHALAGGERYVLAIGTIEPRKDTPLLVRAFDALAADDPDLRLVLAGPDGWGVDDLEAALSAAAHADRVVRTGWVPDADRAALLRGATVLAYPSVYEGFGLPPLEAMTAGVPVVATAAGAVPEVVADGARLVPPGDVDALAEALAAVVAGDGVEALVARGRARAAELTWAATVDGLVALYHQAAG